jgi:hypothetical protein
MKIMLSALVISVVSVSMAFSQKVKDLDLVRQQIIDARREAVREKFEILRSANSRLTAPSDYFDADSFGKNAKFLGSLYAGTLYVYSTCDPVQFEQELGVPLAPDDKCVVHTPTSPMTQSVEFFDPAWEITIPGRTVENVVYPMLNNYPGFDASDDNGTAAQVLFFYTPVVTIESEALNDPAAINPGTGLPMNGSYKTSLTGSQTKIFSLPASGFSSDYQSYASVAGRGLSRTYFAALGLPNNVINKLFKKDMKLKFGLRARVGGPVYFAQFYYTYRLLGN